MDKETAYLVAQAAIDNGIDPKFALRIANAESRFNQSAISKKGAIGVMQLMPDTAEELGVDPTDRQQNIHGGVKYLKKLLDKYDGDQKKAAAAYNWGMGNVDKHGLEKAPSETRTYIANIVGKNQEQSTDKEKVSQKSQVPEQNQMQRYLASLPPERRALAMKYMKQGDTFKDALRQETDNASSFDSFQTQFANNLLRLGRGIQQPFVKNDTAFGAKGSDLDLISQNLNKSHPYSSFAGNAAAEAAKAYALMKVPGVRDYSVANPFKFSGMFGAGSEFLNYGTPEERLKNATYGAVGGILGTGAAKTIGYAGGKAGSAAKKAWQIVDTAITKGGNKRAAARLIGKLATENTDDAMKQIKVNELIDSIKDAPSDYSIGQAATKSGNAPIVAAQDILRHKLPTQYDALKAAQEAGRIHDLDIIKPNLASAEATRTAVTEPLYEAAKDVYTPIVGKMKEIITRLPSGIMKKASENARVSGEKFMRAGANGKPEISGAGMHHIKLALSDIANSSPTTGVGNADRKVAGDLLKEFLDVYGGSKNVGAAANPVYGAARQAYADLSRPINQSKVISGMQSVLQKPGGGERLGMFMNILGDGEEAFLKKASGQPLNTTLDDLLSGGQKAVVKNIGNQLENDVAMKSLVDTGRESALKILRETERPGAGPGLVHRGVSVGNWIMRNLEGLGGDKVDKEVARLMLPENRGEFLVILDKLSQGTREKVYKSLVKQGFIKGGMLSGIAVSDMKD